MAVDLDKVRAWQKTERENESPMCDLWDPMQAMGYVTALVAEVEGLRADIERWEALGVRL